MKMHWICLWIFGFIVLQIVGTSNAKLVRRTLLPPSAEALSNAPELFSNNLIYQRVGNDENWQEIASGPHSFENMAAAKQNLPAATQFKANVKGLVRSKENDSRKATLASSKDKKKNDTNFSNHKMLNEKSNKQQMYTLPEQHVATKNELMVTTIAASVASNAAGVASNAVGAVKAVAGPTVAVQSIAGAPMTACTYNSVMPQRFATGTLKATTPATAPNNSVESDVARKPSTAAVPRATEALTKGGSSTTMTKDAQRATAPIVANSNSNSNDNRSRIASKAYLPIGFINPFGQLVAFLGSDQSQLQNYRFFFNAERQTVFQLHTSMSPAATKAQTATTATRVFNTVSNSLGTIFGATRKPAMLSPQTSHIKVEVVELYDAASLRQSRFNPFNPTRILIHGWFGGANATIYQTLVAAYLRLGDGNYNVFTVDWGRGAVTDYLTASYRVKPVGKVVAKFIDFLKREAGINYEDVHVVGFSMGAHVAGIAGKHLQTGRLPVIYALDPALPFFRYENIAERIAITDADYVEVIHTSVGSYGFDWPLGHVDFYVNYGSAQPGCYFHECSHLRAYQIFAEALDPPWPDAFTGVGCDVELWRDLVRHRRCMTGTGRRLQLGGDPKNVTALRMRGGGVYHLATAAYPPFALPVEEEF